MIEPVIVRNDVNVGMSHRLCSSVVPAVQVTPAVNLLYLSESLEIVLLLDHNIMDSDTESVQEVIVLEDEDFNNMVLEAKLRNFSLQDHDYTPTSSQVDQN